MKVVCVGNPNVGKTSIFNYITGSYLQVGNFSGVTVEKKTATIHINNKPYYFVDLPGIYSFSSRSIDEKITCDTLMKKNEDYPDIIVNIVDASNLENNLYLTTYLLQMKKPIILVLNMMDKVKKMNFQIDVDSLSKKLKIPIVVMNGRSKQGKEQLFNLLDSEEILNTNFADVFPQQIQDEIKYLTKSIDTSSIFKTFQVPTHFLAYQILEENTNITIFTQENSYLQQSKDLTIHNFKKIFSNDLSLVLVKLRYDFIQKMSQYIREDENKSTKQWTPLIDKFFLHQYLGLPIFVLLVSFLFNIAIKSGLALQDFFSIGAQAFFVDYLGAFISNPTLKIFIANGIGGGFSAVASFIPIVFTMFVVINLLTDSGYLIRMNVLVDRLMRKMGLSGKSLAPLIMGFGCNVNSILGSRILESPSERKIAIALSPFLSCSARLPVYVFLTGIFFSHNQGSIIFSLYFLGVVVGIFTAYLLKKVVDPHGENSFLLQNLTMYNIPNVSSILKASWKTSKTFIKRTAKLVIIFTGIFTVLNTITLEHLSKGLIAKGSDKSIIRDLGEFFSKPLALMGIQKTNWPASIGLINGILAKETILATMSVSYQTLIGKKKQENILQSKKRTTFLYETKKLGRSMGRAFLSIPHNFIGFYDQQKWHKGLFLDPRFYIPFYGGFVKKSDINSNFKDASPTFFENVRKQFEDSRISDSKKRRLSGALSAYTFLIFVVLYTSCVQVMSAIKRELGTKWMLGIVAYQFLIAYVVSVVFYQLGMLLIK